MNLLRLGTIIVLVLTLSGTVMLAEEVEITQISPRDDLRRYIHISGHAKFKVTVDGQCNAELEEEDTDYIENKATWHSVPPEAGTFSSNTWTTQFDPAEDHPSVKIRAILTKEDGTTETHQWEGTGSDADDAKRLHIFLVGVVIHNADTAKEKAVRLIWENDEDTSYSKKIENSRGQLKKLRQPDSAMDNDEWFYGTEEKRHFGLTSDVTPPKHACAWEPVAGYREEATYLDRIPGAVKITGSMHIFNDEGGEVGMCPADIQLRAEDTVDWSAVAQYGVTIAIAATATYLTGSLPLFIWEKMVLSALAGVGKKAISSVIPNHTGSVFIGGTIVVQWFLSHDSFEGDPIPGINMNNSQKKRVYELELDPEDDEETGLDKHRFWPLDTHAHFQQEVVIGSAATGRKYVEGRIAADGALYGSSDGDDGVKGQVYIGPVAFFQVLHRFGFVERRGGRKKKK